MLRFRLDDFLNVPPHDWRNFGHKCFNAETICRTHGEIVTNGLAIIVWHGNVSLARGPRHDIAFLRIPGSRPAAQTTTATTATTAASSVRAPTGSRSCDAAALLALGVRPTPLRRLWHPLKALAAGGAFAV